MALTPDGHPPREIRHPIGAAVSPRPGKGTMSHPYQRPHKGKGKDYSGPTYADIISSQHKGGKGGSRKCIIGLTAPTSHLHRPLIHHQWPLGLSYCNQQQGTLVRQMDHLCPATNGPWRQTLKDQVTQTHEPTNSQGFRKKSVSPSLKGRLSHQLNPVSLNNHPLYSMLDHFISISFLQLPHPMGTLVQGDTETWNDRFAGSRLKGVWESGKPAEMTKDHRPKKLV